MAMIEMGSPAGNNGRGHAMARKDTERQSRFDPVRVRLAPLDRSADEQSGLEVIGLDRPPELTPDAARVLLRILRKAAAVRLAGRSADESDPPANQEERTP